MEAIAEQTKLALRHLAGTVVIVTTRHEGHRHAMAATAVSALSLDPPSLLACVNKSASIHGPLSSGDHFGLNILGRRHEELALYCSGRAKGEERFNFGDWDDSGPVPVLRDAEASIILKMDQRHRYGSHTIFIGKVEQVRIVEEGIDPLVYLDGRFLGLRDGAA